MSLIDSNFISDVMVVGEWQLKQVQLVSIRNACRICLKVVIMMCHGLCHTTVSMQLKALELTHTMSGNQCCQIEG